MAAEYPAGPEPRIRTWAWVVVELMACRYGREGWPARPRPARRWRVGDSRALPGTRYARACARIRAQGILMTGWYSSLSSGHTNEEGLTDVDAVQPGLDPPRAIVLDADERPGARCCRWCDQAALPARRDRRRAGQEEQRAVHSAQWARPRADGRFAWPRGDPRGPRSGRLRRRDEPDRQPAPFGDRALRSAKRHA